MSAKVKLPARIIVQIREGAYNTLAEVELDAKPNPATLPNGRKNHEVDTLGIISGLAEAQRKLVLEHRAQVSPAESEETDAWLRDLAAWVIADGEATA